MAARRWTLGALGSLGMVLTLGVLGSGSALAAGAPQVGSVWASEVNRSTARIGARIDPAGADTTYRFEYGLDASYGSSVPVPDGDLGSAEEEVQVSQLLTGLQPGSDYHYRVVATSSAGTTSGEDHVFTTFAPSAPEPADTCPNAAYRVGASQGLPDCRAYEMVSPVDKYGGEVAGDTFNGGDKLAQTFASEWGDRPGEVDRVAFMSKTLFGDVKGSGTDGYAQYIAERGAEGWRTKGILPTPSPSVGEQVIFGKTEMMEFSSDLSMGALISHTLPEGPPAARPKSENEYLEDMTTGRLLAAITDASHEGEPAYPPTVPFASIFEIPALGGGSSSLDVVTFMGRVNYLPEAKGSEYKAYVYERGVLKLLGVLPDGSIPPGGSRLIETSGDSYADGSAIEQKDTVSADGSRILFEVPEFPQQLFMRKNGSASVLVSESETATPVTAENVQLEAATPDLKHILFHSSTRLVDGAPENGGLYMYTDSPNPQSESNLTYIGNSAFSQGNDSVLGMSDDGSHVYYVPGSTVEVDLWDSGQTRQVAPEPGVQPELRIGNFGFGRVEARVTPDGKQVAFMSPDQLTRDAPVSEGAITAGGSRLHSEMYVYKQDTNTLRCVSCPSTHALATDGIEMELAATQGTTPNGELYRPRFMTRDGRYVFFNTTEALVPQDTNGVTDAYEYDAVTGRLSLLSTGMGEGGVWFADSNADGHDVFLVTRQRLSRWDPDKLADLYDVRVDGGLPEPPAPGVPCDGDACQGTPSGAPSFNTASGFVGLGNPSFSKPAAVKSRAKPNRLRRALAVCRKKPKRRRAHCERLARRRYGMGRSSVGNRRAGR